MSLKLVAFLGTGDYEPTRYDFGDAQIAARYFPIALAQYLEPHQLILCLTDKAAKKHGSSFHQELAGKVAVDELMIPDGKNEDELWEIFEQVVGRVGEQDKLAMDITHGFRSLPMIALLIISYLKFVKHIHVGGLWYGSYAARTAEGGQSTSPVFNLTPFVDLLEWIAGANSFVKYGDAEPVGKMLQLIQREIRGRDLGEPTRLQSLGSRLTRVSQALLLGRGEKTRQAILALKQDLDHHSDAIVSELDSWAKPCLPLWRQMAAEYGRLVKVDDGAYELGLVQWYLNRDYVPQGVTLLQECIISRAVAECLGLPEQVNKLAVRGKAKAVLRREGYAENPIGQVFNKLTQLRNDIAHAGYRPHPMEASTMKKNALEYTEEMRGLWREDALWQSLGKEEPLTERVLISPLGSSLSLAASHVRPHRAIIITSKEGAALAEEALKSIGLSRVCCIIVAEPLNCFGEKDRVWGELAKLLSSRERPQVFVNINGGTTALSYITWHVAGKCQARCATKIIAALDDGGGKIVYLDEGGQENEW